MPFGQDAGHHQDLHACRRFSFALVQRLFGYFGGLLHGIDG